MSFENMTDANALTDEQLLARYWQLDLSAEEIRQIDALIASDASVLARWRAIQCDLALLKPQSDVNIAPATLKRLQQQLRLHAQSGLAKPQWPKFAATSAAGAAAVLLWMSLPRTPMQNIGGTTDIAIVSPVPAGQSSKELNRVSLRAVSLHLMEAQAMLARTDYQQTEQRELLADVLAQNQSFQQRAAQQGQADLARVLAALQPVLIELAKADQAELRGGLIEQFEFESHALLTKLQQRSSQYVPDTI